MNWIKSLIERASASAGELSSTRLVWLSVGLGSVVGALTQTIGGVWVYCRHHKADGTYWLAVASTWGIAVGFAASTKNVQKQATAGAAQSGTPGTPGASNEPGTVG